MLEIFSSRAQKFPFEIRLNPPNAFNMNCYTVKPLYTDIRYDDQIRYKDNLNGTIS